ncbi:deferrochelatase/peroxidase EfeB [Naumannella cuiyingiana]|uniref:Deferrochelatase n=1 Tax=Naumannella cuiyingiana TaxID=1347891 RepID=A0A7Z0D9K7_9ACTN|nr:iron uptake transporter deferrochelatase/peroxidase subunit [Naumannella cuiyingiana]NYI71274.1 deferrochelatase/peroxidase EfeB [Naumannella cuiyingiana]
MTLSRRGLIGAAGGAAAVGAAGLAGGLALGRTAEPPPDPLARTYPFHGAHQAGIATPAQDRLHFAAFDVLTDDRAKLARLLRAWTTAAARLTQGLAAGEQGPTGGSYQAPPDDTGEAIGLPPSGLTLTFGVGPALFDRFGLGQRRPEALTPLPAFPGDALDPDRSDGDLCVQACADDPQVAVHAIRNLARIGMGTVSVRWSQLGFGRTSSTSTAQPTPRNMFGFKDGTANLKAEEPDLLDRHVWVPAGRDPREDWLVGGSYLVARRINMTIETWDRTSLAEQERVIGRSKAEGAPLSGGDEFAAPDFAAAGRGGLPLIDPRSHVALAHPDANDGVQLLRRGYNFVDGSTRLGRLDAGLFFLAFVTDPRTHFIPMQTRLASRDALQEYLRHTGSGLWAVLPGVNEGGWLGETLLA